ncbi:MAG: Smr/MutS family protein [Gammaproteobacteria bacterium]|nr:Smr/MutS family protein [Gammaproteobacteria bacterium]
MKLKPMTNEDHSEDTNFTELMTGVKRISDDRINVYHDRAKKIALPRAKTGVSEPSLDFVNISYDQQTKISDSQFDSGIQKKLERKIRRGQLAIGDHLDLHGYTQKEAIAALEEFLHRAVTAELKLLVIIHGKGNRSGSKAVLRPLVRYWLSRQSSVLGWCPAQPKHGGSGASYVYLRV